MKTLAQGNKRMILICISIILVIIIFVAAVVLGYLREKMETIENSLSYSSSSPIEYECREGKVYSWRTPPNSLYGIKEAANNQYDRIRFTMRVTKDGKYVLAHDDLINGIARNKDGTVIKKKVSIANHTLKELDEYDYGIQFGSKYAGMRIPKLEDALRYSNIFNLSVTLEMYDFAPSKDQVKELVLMISKYNQIKNLLLVNGMPFDKQMYQMFKDECPYISYFVGASLDEIKKIQKDIDELKSGKNEIYWCLHPWPAIPSEKEIQYAANHGLLLFYTGITNMNDLKKLGFDKGIRRIQCQDIPMVKEQVRKWANALIN